MAERYVLFDSTYFIIIVLYIYISPIYLFIMTSNFNYTFTAVDFLNHYFYRKLIKKHFLHQSWTKYGNYRENIVNYFFFLYHDTYNSFQYLGFYFVIFVTSSLFLKRMVIQTKKVLKPCFCREI